MNQDDAYEPLGHEEMRCMLEDHSLGIQTEGQQGIFLSISGALIENYNFDNLNLSGVQFFFSKMIGCSFRHSDLYGCKFYETSISNCDFTGANLAKAEIYSATADYAIFENANLTRTEYINTSLRHAVFKHAKLLATIIGDCDITDVNLEGITAEDALKILSNNITDDY